MAAPRYLESFLASDYDETCSANAFCVFCLLGVCTHCCRDHAARHHAFYHPDDVYFAHVRVMESGFGPCVDFHAVRGCGYNWSKILKVRYGSYQTYIPLQRRDPATLPAQAPRQCQQCLDPMRLKGTFCCCSCQLIAEEGGDDSAIALVGTDFGQERLRDIYCTRCRAFFVSAFCDTHVASHHPAGGDIIGVVRSDGWVLTRVEGSVIPHHLFEGIQRISVDGVDMVPIIPRAEPVEGEVGAICIGCFQMIHDGLYCSMRCKSEEQNWRFEP